MLIGVPAVVLGLALMARRTPGRRRAALVLAVGAAQALCIMHALSYSYVEFSPLATLALRYAPRHYHTEPEIFAERDSNIDSYINPADVYVYPLQGKPIKWLYNRAQQGIETKLCGPGMMLAPSNRITASLGNWRYNDGKLRCAKDDGARLQLQLADMRNARILRLEQGWGKLDSFGGISEGAWSIAGV